MRMISSICVFGAAMLISLTGDAYTHVGHYGENLDQLSIQYYGRSELSIVIRAANGFVHPDDGSLTNGELVEIPEITYHRVRSGETWKTLANRYLGTGRRGSFLAKMNDHKPKNQPGEGTIIKVPYHLRHIFASRESIKSVVKLYYGKKRSAKWLKDYNFSRKRRFSRGDALIIPLIDLEFVEEQRNRIDKERSRRFTGADAQGQEKATKLIPWLKKSFDSGRYVEVVATGGHLLATPNITIPQTIGVYKYLAFSYVALGENGLALDAFVEALALQPQMELQPITTSPKILKVFQEAKVIHNQLQQ